MQPKPSLHVPPTTEAITSLSIDSEPAVLVPRECLNFHILRVSLLKPCQQQAILPQGIRSVLLLILPCGLPEENVLQTSDLRILPPPNWPGLLPKNEEARTGVEDNWRIATEPLSLPQSVNTPIYRSNSRSLDDFKMSPNEETTIETFQQQLKTYVLQKHITTSQFHSASDLKTLYFCKHSELYENWKVFSCVFTCVKCPFWEQGHTHANSTGPSQLLCHSSVYDVLQSLKFEYGDDLKWLIVYPGIISVRWWNPILMLVWKT